MGTKIIITVEVQESETSGEKTIVHGGGVLAKMKGSPFEGDSFEREEVVEEDGGEKERIEKSVLSLYKKGVKRTAIQAILRVRGGDYWMIREICDEYDRQRQQREIQNALAED